MPNFLSSINLNQNELQKAVIENYAGNPSGTVSGVDAQMLYDSTNNLVYICEGGTTWVSLSSASGTVTSVSAGNAITITGTASGPIVNHADTSAQSSVNNAGETFIQDVTLDTYGHVTGLASGSVGTYDNYNFWRISDGTTTEAISSQDTLTISGGTNVTASYNATTNILTISSTDNNTTYSAGTGLALTGTVFSLSHLGFEDLVDPNADRIAFWDDSAGAFAWLSAGTNISISGTTISSTNTVTNAFTTIAVAGQSNVVADSTSDTLTFDAGSNITITTDAGTDTLTLSSTDTIDYISAVSFNSGTGNLEFTAVGNAHAANVSLDGRYLTSYTETQTLNDVTTLGATTANAITVGGLTVNGDLTVSGAHTVKLAEEVQMEDSLIVLNSNETGVPSEDAGFVVERGTSTNVAFLWDESADTFVLVSSTETGTTAGDVTIADYEDLRIGGLTTDDFATINGTLKLGTVVNAGVDTDKFLVLDASGNVDFRTGTEVRSDIGAGVGSMSSFNIDADTGTANSITNAETFTIVGGGDVSTSVAANQVTVTFTETYTAHENITAATSANNSGNTFIQDVTVDGNGHVTGLVSTAVSSLDNYQFWRISDGTTTETINSQDTLTITGGGDVTATYTALTNTMEVAFTETYTAHENITAATSINGSGISFIQDVTVDGNGHVTGLASATIRSATTTLTGVVELATDTEASAGTDTTRAVTASGVEQFRADREAVFTISGDATTTAFALTHNFGTRMVMAEIVDFGNAGTGATYETVYADVTRNTDNQVTVTFGAAPSATQDYRVMLRVIA